MPKEIFVLMLVAFVGVFGLASAALRAYVRLKTAQPSIPRGDDRLDQIAGQLATLQQSVDATAIEVERLGEGLRFTTKVLAERNSKAPELRQPERVITPH